MSELCARPGCNTRAVATFTFDGLERIVWVNPLAEAAAFSAGDLCQHHADHMTPPRHWTLLDTRTDAGVSPGPAGANAPSRHHPPANGAGDTAGGDRADPAWPDPAWPDPAWPDPDRPDPDRPDPDRVVHPPRFELRTTAARTPLLARAFRGATAV